MRLRRFLVPLIVMSFFMSACATIRPNQVGVKQTLGRLKDEVKGPGPVVLNPLVTRVVRVQVATANLAIEEDLPSREGLTVRSESSILYSVRAAEVPRLLRETGEFYERDLILPVYRSAAADVCSQYAAKDMHSAKRGEIEHEIRERMAKTLEPKGIVVESVLLKSIKLPTRIAQSIERKLEAEQEALRMEFVAKQQQAEVERQVISEEGSRQIASIRAKGAREAAVIAAEAAAEAARINAEGMAKAAQAEADAARIRAKGEADAQIIAGEAMQAYNRSVNATLSPRLIELRRIEAFQAIGESPNAKMILHDGKSKLVNIIGGGGIE